MITIVGGIAAAAHADSAAKSVDGASNALAAISLTFLRRDFDDVKGGRVSTTQLFVISYGPLYQIPLAPPR
jgi:hypothetical protein